MTRTYHNERQIHATIIVATVAIALCGIASAETLQDFDKGGGICEKGADCVPWQYENDPAPQRFDGGPTGTGKFLRLAYGDPVGGAPSFNTISFDQTDPASDLITVDFDFRITPRIGRGDGFGFSLLNVNLDGIGQSGAVGGTGEEPNFQDSLGVGFDIHENADLDDIGNDILKANFSNSISIHFNGVRMQTDVTGAIDLACGQWIHARIVLRPGGGFSDVSVYLTPPDGPSIQVVDSLYIDGFEPYAGRAHFGARSGGDTADFDLDNINVQYEPLDSSHFSFSKPLFTGIESNGAATVELVRTGDTSAAATVDLNTKSTGSADNGSDFESTNVTVAFAANELSKSVDIPLIDDDTSDGDLGFQVRLRRPSGNAFVAGPAVAGVTIIDDEVARTKGHWGELAHWPIVGVHTHVLPTGDVAIWDRLGAAAIWDPTTNEAQLSNTPGYNLFCSGHAYLPDGLLLATGGHGDPLGSPHADGMGLLDTSLYAASIDTWYSLPDMNDGRWYPTNTPMPNGDMLVVSGSVMDTSTRNTLPQVWQYATSTWRDLTGADAIEPLGVDLYPRMFVAPDGRVFKAGMDQECWYLDTAGVGAWTQGPDNTTGAHIYGTAIMYRPGRILIAGGSDLQTGGEETIVPTSTAEVINLNAANPSWREVQSMQYPRRHLNSVMLPDGSVIVIGGTSDPGFSNSGAPVLPAERWDPKTETWTELDAMRVQREYHSTAFLLPDGRVIAAGGGQGANVPSFQNLAEVFYPPYFFKGERPIIGAAPESIVYGSTFFIATSKPSKIAHVSITRLPSVTHAFDMNQRFALLDVEKTIGGVNVTAPADALAAQPGHYMLFLVNKKGVPSEGQIVRLGN
ncbi:MAG: DUF1929 domain-containing protein [Candidatus Hydrogenedentes bacterium]|nr:DUF1929 domain-containing protein [Candidatus Hydrogenedentota bacterium]